MSETKTFIREDVQGFLALVNSLPPPEAPVPELVTTFDAVMPAVVMRRPPRPRTGRDRRS